MTFFRALMGCLVLAGPLGCGAADEEPDATELVEEPAEEKKFNSGHDESILPMDCDIDTGYPGDQYCQLPPDPDKGFQLHLGPEDYDDPQAIADWEIGPGEENTECFWTRSPNEKIAAFYERLVTMRPVSHHLFLFTMYDAAEPASGLGKGPCRTPEGRGPRGFLAGAEVPIVQYPQGGVFPPEQEGSGASVPAEVLVRIEIHAVNVTDEAMLREVWVNFIYKPTEEITKWVSPISMYAGQSIATPPGAGDLVAASVEVKGDSGMLYNLFGHVHANTTRFTAWLLRDGERTMILEDYDWYDPLTIAYNSVVENEPPDPENLVAGGHSGVLEIKAGDRLEWECEVHNTQDVVLSYTNKAFTGEMCNLFGEYSGTITGLTEVDGDYTIERLD